MSTEADKRTLMALESIAVSCNAIATTLETFQQMFAVVLQQAAAAQPPKDET